MVVWLICFDLKKLVNNTIKITSNKRLPFIAGKLGQYQEGYTKFNALVLKQVPKKHSSRVYSLTWQTAAIISILMHLLQMLTRKDWGSIGDTTKTISEVF